MASSGLNLGVGFATACADGRLILPRIPAQVSRRLMPPTERSDGWPRIVSSCAAASFAVGVYAGVRVATARVACAREGRRKAGRRTRRHAATSTSEFRVQLVTTRPELWRGDALVLFVRRSANGEPDLGRIGKAVDKELGGKLSELLAPGTSPSDGGVVDVAPGSGVKAVVWALIGDGEVDWREIGVGAADALSGIGATSAGVTCVDGVKVQDLVEGMLGDFAASGKITAIDILGAYPPGSADAIQTAQQAVANRESCATLPPAPSGAGQRKFRPMKAVKRVVRQLLFRLGLLT